MDQQNSQGIPTSTEEVDALVAQLERQMPDLQMRHANIFALANAWAERHDAILAAVPHADRGDVAARLARIGIRWGMVPGARVTTEFRALAATDAPMVRLRRKA
jgi:hypothetical protein